MAEKIELTPWVMQVKIAMLKRGNMKVGELAKKLGYDRSYMSSIVNGRVVSPPARKRVSDFLGISDSDEE